MSEKLTGLDARDALVICVGIRLLQVSYHAPFREDWETTPRVDPASTAGISFKDFAIDGLVARPTQEGGSTL